MSNSRFMLSTSFINTLLNNNFGIPSFDFPTSDIYVGLGIEFDADTFTFTKDRYLNILLY